MTYKSYFVTILRTQNLSEIHSNRYTPTPHICTLCICGKERLENRIICGIVSGNTNQTCFKEHQGLVCTYSRKKKKLPFVPPRSAVERGAFSEFSDANSWMFTGSGGVRFDLQHWAWTGPSELRNNSRKDAFWLYLGLSTGLLRVDFFFFSPNCLFFVFLRKKERGVLCHVIPHGMRHCAHPI